MTAINLAIKYNEDDYNDNAFVAKVCGITLEEMNILEVKFLQLLNFELHVYQNHYPKYYNTLKEN